MFLQVDIVGPWLQFGAFGLLAWVLFWIARVIVPQMLTGWRENMHEISEALKGVQEALGSQGERQAKGLGEVRKSLGDLRLTVVRMDARVRAEKGDTPTEGNVKQG